MDLNLSPQDEAFRDEVRAFLDAKLTPDLREADRRAGGRPLRDHVAFLIEALKPIAGDIGL